MGSGTGCGGICALAAVRTNGGGTSPGAFAPEASVGVLAPGTTKFIVEVRTEGGKTRAGCTERTILAGCTGLGKTRAGFTTSAMLSVRTFAGSARAGAILRFMGNVRTTGGRTRGDGVGVAGIDRA